MYSHSSPLPPFGMPLLCLVSQVFFFKIILKRSSGLEKSVCFMSNVSCPNMNPDLLNLMDAINTWKA